MKFTLGEKITEARIALRLSQQDVADRINKRGVSVTNQKISKWETNYTVPNAIQFLALCDVLHIDDVLGTFLNKDDNSPMGRLNNEGKTRVNEYIDLLLISGRYSKRPEDDRALYTRNLPLYDLAVSAGTGKYLDSSSSTLVEVGTEVPLTADFGVRISGNSMEPRFVTGQIVWIHSQQFLEDGEIGIFSLNENSYCKKISISKECVKLISLNPDYKPIEVPADSELKCFGKVVG